MSERMYHINLCKEELEGAKAVILPGDPGRVPKIAALLQEAADRQGISLQLKKKPRKRS